MLGKKLGIDVGTSRLRVVVRGEDVVIDEPSVVLRGPDDAPVAFGQAAIDKAAAEGGTTTSVIDGDVISDHGGTAAMLLYAINRSAGRQRIFKPDVVVAVHSSMSGSDRRAVLDMLAHCGVRAMYVLDAPVAAAMGAGAVLTANAGHLTIDIGERVVEVAVLAHEGTIAGRVFRVDRTAQSNDVILREIVNAGREVLAEMPQQLMRDIRREGALLTGGGSRDDLADQLTAALGIPVRALKEPEFCTVRGAGMAVDSLDVLRRSFMYIR